MAASIRSLVAGNWKMNGLQQSTAELTRMIAGSAGPARHADLMICPPATLLNRFSELARGTAIAIGAQDCHSEASGAFTGDLSAEMLKDAGAVAVIVGHSERRTLHQETDEIVKAKAQAVWRAGLTAIVCLGETRAEREASQTLTIIRRQFDHSLPDDASAAQLVIAYEPVWAIGTGLTPTPGDIAEVHGFLRQRLTARYSNAGASVRILYGGSVKPANAKELMAIADVNGALIGGASLKADDFLAIANAYS